MPAPVCVKCLKFMRPQKNGVTVEERMPVTNVGQPEESQWAPYKLWEADLWWCKTCEFQIIVGWAKKPFAEHHDDNYHEYVCKIEGAGERIYRINDC